jgi:hypothetical protein
MVRFMREGYVTAVCKFGPCGSASCFTRTDVCLCILQLSRGKTSAWIFSSSLMFLNSLHFRASYIAKIFLSFDPHLLS